jgi:hypothetical protein
MQRKRFLKSITQKRLISYVLLRIVKVSSYVTLIVKVQYIGKKSIIFNIPILKYFPVSERKLSMNDTCSGAKPARYLPFGGHGRGLTAVCPPTPLSISNQHAWVSRPHRLLVTDSYIQLQLFYTQLRAYKVYYLLSSLLKCNSQ